MDEATLAHLLRQHRTVAALTQDELAHSSGVSVRTIRSIEAGDTRNPRLDSMRRLAEALGLTGQDRARFFAAVHGGPDSDRRGSVPRDVRYDGAPSPVPAQLPPDVVAFIGRAQALAELDRLLLEDSASPRAAVMSAIDGTAGVGKTALAVHWAHRVRSRFPDGQLFVDLRGYAVGPPLTSIEALTRLLRALGVPGEAVPTDVEEATAVYRSLLADKRMLVVLDNASSPAQVRPMLPTGPGSVALVTSRDRLGGLVARDGAHRLALDVLPADYAQALLSRVLGTERIRAEPQALADLARLCGYLPLALRIAAANLTIGPGPGIADYVAQLSHPDRLAALAVSGDPHSAVAGAFDLSYTRLPEPARRLFRLLGLVPGPDVTVAAAAALAGVEVEQAGQTLELLTGMHLVEESTPGRYTCHDLLRRYAADRAEREETESGRQAARTRLLDWYLRLAQTAASLLFPQVLRLPGPDVPGSGSCDDHAEAQAWFDAENTNLVAAITDAAEHGPRAFAWLLADCVRGHWWQGGHLVDWLTAATVALAAAEREADLRAQAAARLSLGTVHQRLGNYEAAIDHYAAVIDLAGRVGWADAQAAARGNSGVAERLMGRLDRAQAQLTAALALDRDLGRLSGQAANLSNLGVVQHERGELGPAASSHTESLEIFGKLGGHYGEITALNNLSSVACDEGRLDAARQTIGRALALCRTFGHRYCEASALDTLAAVHHVAGRYDDAIQSAEAATRLAAEIGADRAQAEAHNTLGSVYLCLGQPHQAITDHQRALDLARQHADRLPEIAALVGLAAAHSDLGRHKPALRHAMRALHLARTWGYRLREGQALTILAEIHHDAGDHDQAGRYAERALANHRQTGHRLGAARTHAVLGHLRQHRRDTAAAQHHWQQAYQLFADIGTPEAEQVAALLADGEG